MQIVWLEEAECCRVGLVGGKTANLSRLAALYPVPLGFCLTTLAAQQALEAPQMQGDGGSPPLPAALYAALAVAYRTLAERLGSAEPCVAVRSSAVDEDGQDVSFAGQHDTYLKLVVWMQWRQPCVVAGGRRGPNGRSTTGVSMASR